MTDYWELWQNDSERWNDIVNRLATGVVAALQRLLPESEGTVLHPARWDLPGFELITPPAWKPGDPDGASRAVYVYAELQETGPVIQFGGTAWFDEQGPAPPEPWTRWWCHTARSDEAEWAIALEAPGDLARAVELNVEELMGLTYSWHWDLDTRTWSGNGLEREDPATYSSPAPSRRIG